MSSGSFLHCDRGLLISPSLIILLSIYDLLLIIFGTDPLMVKFGSARSVLLVFTSVCWFNRTLLLWIFISIISSPKTSGLPHDGYRFIVRLSTSRFYCPNRNLFYCSSTFNTNSPSPNTIACLYRAYELCIDLIEASSRAASHRVKILKQIIATIVSFIISDCMWVLRYRLVL